MSGNDQPEEMDSIDDGRYSCAPRTDTCYCWRHEPALCPGQSLVSFRV